jgi:hypothetical protein
MDGYARAHYRYGQIIAETIRRAFLTAGGVDDRAAETFIARATAAAAAGRAGIARLTAGFLTRQVGLLTDGEIRAVTVALDDLTTPQLRTGVSDDDLWLRPVIAARAGLGRGDRYPVALAAGAALATMTAHTDVALAQRTAARVALVDDPRVVGTRRVPGWSSCTMCAGNADRVFRVLELMPIHSACRCTVSTVVDGRDPAARRNRVTAAAATKPPAARVEIDHTTEIAPSLVEVT